MAFWVQLLSLQLATLIFYQMAAKTYGCMNKCEPLGSVWVWRGERVPGFAYQDYKTDHHWTGPGQKQTSKSRGNLAFCSLVGPESKGWFQLYMNVWLFSGPQQTRRNWMVSSEAEKIHKDREKSIFFPASVKVLWTIYLYTISSNNIHHTMLVAS